MGKPLPYELMGLFVLGVLWVNTLLVVAAAYKEIAALAALARRFVPLGPTTEGTGLLIGRVTRGDGVGRILATHGIPQVGRLARGDEPVVLFEDRPAESASFGGAIEAEGRTVEIPPLTGSGVEVWHGPDALREAAACPSPEAFDAALPDARKARGFSRKVTANIPEGSVLYAFGALRKDGPTPRLAPAADGTLILSTIDPRSFCGQKTRLGWLFLFGVLALAAGVTALALHDPIVSTTSKLGGALGLAFFLLVQPAGTGLAGALARPSVAALRGEWRRPGRAS
ncbi:hypothetical protein [Polyangium sp. y55x31]|uniref:hypothetical protein n=1 Tax=Polyangium sp. y55x31 TaxID=3042688 RepID=UPI002482C4D7|nr:hypothetical protein [Polyangium sp. y55x31]MDI1474993.1 hypothetical protein [Polyangium sp. y55x31]